MKSVEWLSLQVRITIEVPSPDALLNIIFEDQEEHVEDVGYQGPHLLKLISASLKSNTFKGIYLAVNIFDNEDDSELESGSKNCKDRRCIFDEVYFRMWSSNLWIARRRDLLEGSVFCPLGIMTFKSKPSPSSQVLDGSVFVLHPIAKPSIGLATSKAELEFVKNIFSVINQLPDYLHPFLNLRINFFPLIRNSQNGRQTMESILHLLRIISNPSQE
nr:hypothetical protein Iba_chr04aCG24320 [Ipomoea batatas]